MKPLLIQLRETQLFYFCDQIDVMGVIDMTTNRCRDWMLTLPEEYYSCAWTFSALCGPVLPYIGFAFVGTY